MSTITRMNVFFRPFRYTRYTYTTGNILLATLLLPSLVHGVILYGAYALRVVCCAVAASLVWDVVFERLFGKQTRVYDGSALYNGLLLGMLLPPMVPWWVVTIAAGGAQFLGKQLFGGAGGSPFNAVCVGWAVVMVSWPQLLDPGTACISFSLPFEQVEFPLSVLRRVGSGAQKLFPLRELLMGHQAGTVGTGAPLLLAAGGTVAVLLGLVPWVIPVSFILSMVVTAIFFIPEGASSLYFYPLFEVLTGYSMIGAFFLAGDFSSRPVSTRVMVVYGAVAGMLTVVFRHWSVFPEGVPFALLIVNMSVPLLDRGRSPRGSLPEVVRL